MSRDNYNPEESLRAKFSHAFGGGQTPTPTEDMLRTMLLKTEHKLAQAIADLSAANVRIAELEAELAEYRDLIEEIGQMPNPDADEKEQIDAILHQLIALAAAEQGGGE